MDLGQVKQVFCKQGEVRRILEGNVVLWEKVTHGVTDITTNSLPDGTSWSSNSNITYSGSLAYSGVTLAAISDLPVTWSAEGLPSGLSINANTGVISGTITAEDLEDIDYTVTVKATDGIASVSENLGMKVISCSPRFGSSGLTFTN